MPARRTKRGKSTDGSSAPGSAANSRTNSRASTPSNRKAGGGRRNAARSSGAAEAEVEAEPTLDPSADFVDLTGEMEDEGAHASSDVVFLSKLDAPLPSATSDVSVDDTDDAPGAAPPAPKPEAPARKSVFTPFRPMLQGVKIDSDPEEGEVDEAPKDDSTAEVKDEVVEQPAEPTGPAPPPPPALPKKTDGLIIEDDDEPAANTSVLLLPDNVHVAGADSEDEEADVTAQLDGVHMVDDNNTRGIVRYWDDTESDLAHFLAEADQSKVCRNCKRPGHTQYECTHTICTTCGAVDQHTRQECPWSLICFGCGQRGHRKTECPDPASRKLRKIGCDRCGVWDHTQNSCPSLWRVYVYRKPEDRNRVMEEKENAEGWKKQAIGGDPDERWCYNCGQEGHFGDDCPIERGSLARAAVNSAFSDRTAGRGPYALSRRQGKHTVWEDDLPYASRGGFKGGNAGAKSREKERERQRARDRNRDRNDGDDWFSHTNSTPVTGMGRQGWGSERRYDRGNDRDRGSPRRPWDSERRRSPSPDRRSRGRYQPPPQPLDRRGGGGGGGITFGKITGNSLGRGQAQDSPSARRNHGQGGQSLLQRAIGQSQSQGSGRSSQSQGQRGSQRHHPYARNERNDKRGGARDRDRDFEADWRASGAGGGNVSRWGDDLDREMKQVRDDRARAGPVRGPGRGKGQRYTGGY